MKMPTGPRIQPSLVAAFRGFLSGETSLARRDGWSSRASLRARVTSCSRTPAAKALTLTVPKINCHSRKWIFRIYECAKRPYVMRKFVIAKQLLQRNVKAIKGKCRIPRWYIWFTYKLYKSACLFANNKITIFFRDYLTGRLKLTVELIVFFFLSGAT